jgi:hypothetical protein
VAAAAAGNFVDKAALHRRFHFGERTQELRIFVALCWFKTQQRKKQCL